MVLAAGCGARDVFLLSIGREQGKYTRASPKLKVIFTCLMRLHLQDFPVEGSEPTNVIRDEAGIDQDGGCVRRPRRGASDCARHRVCYRSCQAEDQEHCS